MSTGLKVGAFSISELEFRKLDQPINENTVKLTDEQGGGFEVMLEVFHQLHCLVNLNLSEHFFLPQSAGSRCMLADQGYQNLIRKYTYQDYYATRDISWTDPPDMVRTHVGSSQVTLFRFKPEVDRRKTDETCYQTIA